MRSIERGSERRQKLSHKTRYLGLKMNRKPINMTEIIYRYETVLT